MGLKEMIDTVITSIEETEVKKQKMNKHGIVLRSFIPELEVEKGFFEVCDCLGLQYKEMPCQLNGHRKVCVIYRNVMIWAYVQKDRWMDNPNDGNTFI